MLFEKPLETIQEVDLQELVDDRYCERKRIEYKLMLPGKSETDKNEFLADVSSFANAQGGDLLYGVEEQEGCPTCIKGLGDINVDAEILRLENMITRGIQPRISGFATVAIPLGNSEVVIVIRVPRSWNPPHMVSRQELQRFYSRNTNGKYRLDVAEIRAAFLLSERLEERIRRFRAERLALISSGEAAVCVAEGPKIVLHIVPLRAFAPSSFIDLGPLSQWRNQEMLLVLGAGTGERRYNFDGYLTYWRNHALPQEKADAYTQLFRNGVIEAVSNRIAQQGQEVWQRWVMASFIEEEILRCSQDYMRLLDLLKIAPPLVVMLSLTDARGRLLYAAGQSPVEYRGAPIDRDVLVFPEVLAEDTKLELENVFKPAFDALWNAGGWPRSPSYNDDGVWDPIGRTNRVRTG